MLEKLREYLGSLPEFADEVENEFNSMGASFTNPEELRTARDQAIINVAKHLKAEGQPYRIVYFYTYTVVCLQCEEKLVGAYVEINNPVTAKGTYLNHLLYHGFVEHGALSVEEPNIDMSGNLDGARGLPLDLKLILKVLEQTHVPQAVTEEVHAYFAAKAAI